MQLRAIYRNVPLTFHDSIFGAVWALTTTTSDPQSPEAVNINILRRQGGIQGQPLKFQHRAHLFFPGEVRDQHSGPTMEGYTKGV